MNRDRFTCEEFYELVWSRPMTTLAKEFGLSDVALHKICRKHSVPTPPLGYWAKKAHGKPVKQTPLPRDSYGTIEIMRRAPVFESAAVAKARALAAETPTTTEAGLVTPELDPIIAASIAHLAKAKAGRDQLVTIGGNGLVTIAVRPESVARATALLEALGQAASRAGVRLVRGEAAAEWEVEGARVSFAVKELYDQIEHVPTEKETRAVERWEAERQASFRRHGYLSDYGRPVIPKWEYRMQGRLGFALEEVRDRTQDSYWGRPLRWKFNDTKKRDVARAIPQVVAGIVAIALTKRENWIAQEARRRAREEADRQRAEKARLEAIEQDRVKGLNQVEEALTNWRKLARVVAHLDEHLDGKTMPPRLGRFRDWPGARLERYAASLEPLTLEDWLERRGLFVEGEDVPRYPL